MNRPESHDPLDACLQEQNLHLEDDGFTARVMAVLPRRRRRWVRPTLLLGATAIGAGLAVRWLPWRELKALDSVALISFDPRILFPWVVVTCVLFSLAWATVTALQQED